MTIFFTGCTHFHHANIIKLANRPFTNVQEMDEALVERWNSVVSMNDTVYHLGDVGWFNSDKTALNMLDRLNGDIQLLQGNHDQTLSAPAYREIKLADTEFILFHYPIEDWNGRWRGSIHLHCHTHKPDLRNPNIPYVTESGLDMGDKTSLEMLPARYPPALTCNRFNVGVDATNFTPIALEEILAEAH